MSSLFSSLGTADYFHTFAALENKDFYSIYRKNTNSFNRLFLSQRQDKYKREEHK